MKTIFLAAGKSSRMAPFEEKNLLSFCGKPLIQHLIENAQKGGLGPFIIVCNKKNKPVFEKILFSQKNCSFVLQEDLKTGMAGGVLAGLSQIQKNEPIFILGGNDFVSFQIYKKIIQEGEKHDGSLLAKKVSHYFPGGYLSFSSKKILSTLIEKPVPGKEPSSFINIVAHYFKNSQDLKQALLSATSSHDDIYETALQSLFQTKKFKAVFYNDFWETIKYPWHILSMMKKFLFSQKSFIAPSVQIADTARIRGKGVILSDGVRLFDNAVVVGPCFIGKNTIIGNNALVRESNIGDNCIIGYNSEVARSFLNNNVQTHIAYVGDSVIDSGVNFGAFSCTANLRLDQKDIKITLLKNKNRINSQRQKLGSIIGKNTQIGIHALMMPGCILPKNSFINPNEIKK